MRDEIQRIALEFPYYGWPRITRELGDRGWPVNHKRVYRIMREDNLLCLRKRKFLAVTTNSHHDRPIYPNLARGMTPTGINQLWVADITYIRLELEFVYLAVILDAHSRRVIGWALDRTLEDELTITALRMALDRRSPMPGLIHHSDRGVQYASGGYTGLLKDHHITISMSRKGNRSAAFRTGPGQTLRTHRMFLRPTHRRDELRPAIPRRVARQHCPPPLHRQPHPKTVPGSGTMNFQRTVNSVLTVCLSPGDNPKTNLGCLCPSPSP